ncbi:MAG TPA: rod shape-determining protein MreC [Actinobacteria bacterium]|nr:rod shape-determining protein MreC [Actinomycetota bacterium]
MLSHGRRFDRTTALFLSLLAVAFIAATFDVRSDGGGVGGVMRDGAQLLFAPVQRAVGLVAAPFVGFVDGVSNLAGLRAENERLRREVARLEAQVRETEALERRVAELEAISGLEPPQELAAVTARIFASGASDFDQIRFLDKGKADGILPGAAVIDEHGLVGRVDRVTEHNARVRLITDPLVSVGVRVQPSNETGVVTGRGGDVLRLEMFQATEPVYEGDVVVTDGSRYPPGILVGYVTETADVVVGFVLRTSVEPAADLAEVDFVKVVVGWSPLDAGLVDGEEGVEPPPFVEPPAADR